MKVLLHFQLPVSNLDTILKELHNDLISNMISGLISLVIFNLRLFYRWVNYVLTARILSPLVEKPMCDDC